MSLAIELLKDYIPAAKSTAQPAAYDYAYLVPALLGEYGEVYGQLAKAHWHEWPEDKLKMEMVAEYGDMCWMVAILIDKRSCLSERAHVMVPPVGFAPHVAMGVVGRRISTFLNALEAETRMTQVAIQEPDDTAYLVVDAQQDETDYQLMQLWNALANYAEQCTGSSFQEVLDYNKEKLASRAARGVLRGAGDHR